VESAIDTGHPMPASKNHIIVLASRPVGEPKP